MKRFHILTLIIAGIIFCGLFIYIGVKISEKDTTYSPIIPNCPDFWKTDLSGNCIIPQTNINTGNLKPKFMYYYGDFNKSEFSQGYSFLPEMKLDGKTYQGNPTITKGYTKMDIPYGLDQSNPTYINFTDPMWASDVGDPYCGIQKWANIHQIQWDGLKHYTC